MESILVDDDIELGVVAVVVMMVAECNTLLGSVLAAHCYRDSLGCTYFGWDGHIDIDWVGRTAVAYDEAADSGH